MSLYALKISEGAVALPCRLHAQVILHSASEKACFIARLVGAELVHGIGDALKMFLGISPTDTLMRSSYKMLCNPDATAVQVVEIAPTCLQPLGFPDCLPERCLRRPT